MSADRAAFTLPVSGLLAGSFFSVFVFFPNVLHLTDSATGRMSNCLLYISTSSLVTAWDSKFLTSICMDCGFFFIDSFDLFFRSLFHHAQADFIFVIVKSYAIFSLLPKDLKGLVIIEKPLKAPMLASKPMYKNAMPRIVRAASSLPCVTIPTINGRTSPEPNTLLDNSSALEASKTKAEVEIYKKIMPKGQLRLTSKLKQRTTVRPQVDTEILADLPHDDSRVVYILVLSCYSQSEQCCRTASSEPVAFSAKSKDGFSSWGCWLESVILDDEECVAI